AFPGARRRRRRHDGAVRADRIRTEVILLIESPASAGHRAAPQENPMTVATLSFRPLMVATLAVAVLASSGCSWIRNKWGNEAEYQASRQNQPLEVPPGLDV